MEQTTETFDLTKCSLLPIDSGEKAKSESHHMKHAMWAMWQNKMFRPEDLLFSMRDAHGARVLSMMVRDGACMHIVGLANRPPTGEELVALEPLLADKGFTLSYTGPYMGQR